MTVSIASTQQLPKIPFGCDQDGLVAKPKLNLPGCDQNGWVAKPNIELPSFCGVDRFERPAKNNPNIAETPSEEKKSNKGKILTAAVLLIGGALLGYGHRKYIEKGVDAVKGKVGEWASTGKAAELIEKGKGLLAKAKDAIFVKKA